MARFATIVFQSFLSSLILIVCTAPAAAEPGRSQMDDPFEITADEITYDAQRDLYVAERNVRVIQGGRSLRARWVAFSTETRLGVAEGGVEIAEGTSQLNAEFMVFDVDTLRGTLYQAELDALDQGFHVQAK